MKNNDDFKMLTFSVGYSSIWSTSFSTLTHLISHIDSVSCNIPSYRTKKLRHKRLRDLFKFYTKFLGELSVLTIPNSECCDPK